MKVLAALYPTLSHAETRALLSRAEPSIERRYARHIIALSSAPVAAKAPPPPETRPPLGLFERDAAKSGAESAGCR